jgi:hypothetical protein
MWDYLFSDEGVLMATWLQAIGTMGAVMVSLFVTVLTLRHQAKSASRSKQDTRLQNLARGTILIANVREDLQTLKDASANNGGEKPVRALKHISNLIIEDYRSLREVMLRDLPNAKALIVMAHASNHIKEAEQAFDAWIQGEVLGEFESLLHMIISKLGCYAEALDRYQFEYAKDICADLVMPDENEFAEQDRLMRMH